MSRQKKYILPSRPSITTFLFLQPSGKQIIIQDSVTGLALKVDMSHVSRTSWIEAECVVDMIAVSTDHDRHRRSRAPLEPFFSRAGITKVESRVVERVKKLCDRFMASQNTGKVVHLGFALSSLTTGMSREALDTGMKPSHQHYRYHLLNHLRRTKRLPRRP